MAKSYEGIQPVPFGSYQLVERLAMGGMAEVYLARPDGQDRLVALKRILPSIAADDEFIAMFIDEAKIAGQLNHPSIAQILDLGKINSSYFISMEYVSGHDLRAIWDRTRDDGPEGKTTLPISVACFVTKKICDGLDYAHRRRDAKGRPLGIIHRDVSPQNILISYDGDLKIIDFGIAKAANRIVRTQTGILKGKFAYMAPEQARGEPTDHRADIFAIGVILYELLTGERAFKAESDFALLEKVRRVDLPPPRQLRAEIPKDLERIVAKALAKEAADRYAWASSLGSDLDRFMSDQGFASSKEELAAFVQRTFRQEHAEEKRRLAAYRSLFDDGELSAATMVREKRPDLDTGNSGDGTAEGAGEATSFENAETQASNPKPRVGGGSGAQPLPFDVPSESASMLRADTQPGDVSQGSDSDDEIDASAEASALGAALSSSVDHPETAPVPRHSTDSEPPPPFSAPDAPPAAASKGPNRKNGNTGPQDATQLDPELARPALVPKASPAPVARDEMPKRVRVVSARPETSAPKASELPPPVNETDRVQSAPSSPPSDEGRPGTRTDRVDRGDRGDRSSPERDSPAPERSVPDRAERPDRSVSRRAPPPTPTGPVLLAALLGAIIGGGLIGIAWLAGGSEVPAVVFVASPRQAEVRRGDEVLCRQTPCAVKLAVGRHEIRIRAPGAEEVARTVEVKAEGAPPVEVVLVRSRDDVRIETDPPNAQVQLDGKPLPGQTPLTLPRLVVGSAVRIKITHDGFDPLEITRAVDDEPVWRYELPTSVTTWTVAVVPPDALAEGLQRNDRMKDGKLTVTVQKKSTQVRLSRPGCDAQQLTLYATGRRDAEQKVAMVCRPLNAGLAIRTAGRRPQVRIDGTDVSRDANLEPYPLPAGTFTVILRGSRGKGESHTVELREGETLTLNSKLK